MFWIILKLFFLFHWQLFFLFIFTPQLKPTKEDDPENLICHFVGHVGPIVAMTFDPSGLLLVTADKHGHRFHVYRIQPHPCCAQLAAVHHLYILHR